LTIGLFAAVVPIFPKCSAAISVGIDAPFEAAGGTALLSEADEAPGIH